VSNVPERRQHGDNGVVPRSAERDPFATGFELTTKHSGTRLYFRLLREARSYWMAIAGLLLLQIVAAPLKLLMPVPLKLVVDNVLGSRPVPGVLRTMLPSAAVATTTGLLVFAVVLLVTVTALIYLQALALWVAQTYTAQKLVLSFRAKLFHHVQRLSLSYHDSRGSTDSTYRIQYDAEAIQKVALGGVIPFVTACVTILGFLVVMIVIDPVLALVATAVIPALLVFTRFFGRRLRKEWKTVKEVESSAMSVLQETLGSLRVVKAFGQESRQHRRFVDKSSVGVHRQIRVAYTQGGFDLLVGITTALGTATVLFFGVQHVLDGRLTLGNLLIVMTYLTQLYGPLEVISRKAADLQSGLASAERAFLLLDERPEVAERDDARPIDRSHGEIRFDGLSFGYEPGVTVLRDVSLVIPAGARVGIVGKTGVGKSTLVNLLMRFHDPTRGCIELDGVDLRDYELRGLRNQFALVLQDPVLFSTTIAENIAYARPGADMDAVVAAARAADAHEFIEGLPEGYETCVGERGMRLSGGERQRISLARAFLKDAPILMLDEPTSAVDVKTERSIMETMGRLMEGRTSLMITHRPGTLAGCDLLLRIVEGRVVTIPTEAAHG
jgi:ATP-binding cassette subfamily B protein